MINKKAHVISFDDSPLSYAESINSSDYNKILNSLKSGVLRAINRSRETNSNLDSFNKALQTEDFLFGNINNYLNRDITKSTFPYNKVFISGYDPIVINDSNGFRQHALYGTVTCGYADADKFSKVVRYTDANGVRRPTADTTITWGEVGASVELPNTHNIYNILDNKMDTFWIEDVVAGTNYSLEITFPSSLRPTINALELIPFPSNSFDIVSINVDQANGLSLDITDSVTTTSVHGAGPIHSHFKPVSWGNKITMVIKPRTNIIGISNLDIFDIKYSDTAIIKFKVDDSYSSIGSFNHVTIDPIKNDLGFKFYGDSSVDKSNWSSEDVTITFHDGLSGIETVVKADGYNHELGFTANNGSASNDLYISIEFDKKNGQTPVFTHLAFTPNNGS